LSVIADLRNTRCDQIVSISPKPFFPNSVDSRLLEAVHPSNKMTVLTSSMPSDGNTQATWDDEVVPALRKRESVVALDNERITVC
jgi:hypothetical protein